MYKFIYNPHVNFFVQMRTRSFSILRRRHRRFSETRRRSGWSFCTRRCRFSVTCCRAFRRRRSLARSTCSEAWPTFYWK